MAVTGVTRPPVDGCGLVFRQPNAPDCAFNGGTSLSKVYRASDRFSEDVDVTVSTQEPRILGGAKDPLDDSISNSRRKALNEQAAENLNHYLKAVVAPYVSDHASVTLPSWHRPEVLAEAASIRIVYPSVLPQNSEPPYIELQVRLEFGTRGGTEPRAPHTELARPHRALQERYARHWYDLHRLSTHPSIGRQALAATSALAHVIDMKAKRFRSGGVHYEDCGRGALRLAPDGTQRTLLHDD